MIAVIAWIIPQVGNPQVVILSYPGNDEEESCVMISSQRQTDA
jgi:hypothetical protein